jgi:hypothetical protein
MHELCFVHLRSPEVNNETLVKETGHLPSLVDLLLRRAGTNPKVAAIRYQCLNGIVSALCYAAS